MTIGIVPVQVYRPGGNVPVYDVTAAAVIKASPGVLYRVVVQLTGSAGVFTLNDCATTGAAAASNQILTIAYNATGMVDGTTLFLEWPCNTGIVVSVVTTGGVIAVSYA